MLEICVISYFLDTINIILWENLKDEETFDFFNLKTLSDPYDSDYGIKSIILPIKSEKKEHN